MLECTAKPSLSSEIPESIAAGEVKITVAGANEVKNDLIRDLPKYIHEDKC